MKGRWLILGAAIVLAGFTALLWWTQTRAFYFEMPVADSVDIAGRTVAVSDFRGIDASSSPIKMRACMTMSPGDLDGLVPSADATPLRAPPWFECFDVKALTKSLEAGEAVAYLAATGEFEGSRRFVAVYPDGRAFMWRQLSEEFSR